MKGQLPSACSFMTRLFSNVAKRLPHALQWKTERFTFVASVRITPAGRLRSMNETCKAGTLVSVIRQSCCQSASKYAMLPPPRVRPHLNRLYSNNFVQTFNQIIILRTNFCLPPIFCLTSQLLHDLEFPFLLSRFFQLFLTLSSSGQVLGPAVR
jgi:hypothetical protein